MHTGHTLVLSLDEIVMLCALWLMSTWSTHRVFEAVRFTNLSNVMLGLSLDCPKPCSVRELFWENCTMLLKDMVIQQSTKAMVNYFHFQIHIEVQQWKTSVFPTVTVCYWTLWYCTWIYCSKPNYNKSSYVPVTALHRNMTNPSLLQVNTESIPAKHASKSTKIHCVQKARYFVFKYDSVLYTTSIVISVSIHTCIASASHSVKQVWKWTHFQRSVLPPKEVLIFVEFLHYCVIYAKKKINK